MQSAFILGSARCGSTLVSDILNLHPDLLSLSEVFSAAGARAFPHGPLTGAQFWRDQSLPDRMVSAVANPRRAPHEFLYGKVSHPRHDPWHCPPILSIALPHLSDRPDDLFDWLAERAKAQPFQPVQDHYRSLFTTLARQYDRKVWVERSGGSLAAARTLHQLFPEGRFVLLTRNGPDTALSMQDYPASRLAVRMADAFRPFGIDLLHPDSHYGRGRIWPQLQKLGWVMPMQYLLDTPPDLARVGAFWSTMMVRGIAAYTALPADRRMHLAYEDLVARPEQEIRRLGTFLCGEAPESWVRAAACLPQARPSRADALPRAKRERLEAACAPGMAALRTLTGG